MVSDDYYFGDSRVDNTQKVVSTNVVQNQGGLIESNVGQFHKNIVGDQALNMSGGQNLIQNQVTETVTKNVIGDGITNQGLN